MYSSELLMEIFTALLEQKMNLAVLYAPGNRVTFGTVVIAVLVLN